MMTMCQKLGVEHVFYDLVTPAALRAPKEHGRNDKSDDRDRMMMTRNEGKVSVCVCVCVYVSVCVCVFVLSLIHI